MTASSNNEGTGEAAGNPATIPKTMTTIEERQNSPLNLDRMAAARQLYSSVKTSRRARVLISALLAIVGVVAAASNSESAQGWLALVCLVLVAITPALKHNEETNNQTAASIQEQFDCDVLGIEQNEALTEPVSPEAVNEAARAFGSDRSKIKDWYGGLAGAAGLADEWKSLLCQRSSCVWDSRLRRKYAWGCLVLSILALVATTVVGFAMDLKLMRFVVALVPVLPTVFHGVDVWAEHRKAAATRDKLRTHAQQIWSDALKSKAPPTQRARRKLQNEIYHARATALGVPDWFANRLRGDSEADAAAGIKQFADEARSRLGIELPPPPTTTTGAEGATA